MSGPACTCGSLAVIDERRHDLRCARRRWFEDTKYDYIVTLTNKQADMLWKMPGFGDVEVQRVLDDHVLEVTDTGWSLEHPLRCRKGSLQDCPVHQAATRSLLREGGVPGRYRVRVADDAATKLAFLGPVDA